MACPFPIYSITYRYLLHHTNTYTQKKVECMVAEKKKILTGDFKYILKHHLIMSGCHFILDLFFNKFMFFCCSHSKNFGEFSSKPTGSFSKTFPRISWIFSSSIATPSLEIKFSISVSTLFQFFKWLFRSLLIASNFSFFDLLSYTYLTYFYWQY